MAMNYLEIMLRRGDMLGDIERADIVKSMLTGRGEDVGFPENRQAEKTQETVAISTMPLGIVLDIWQSARGLKSNEVSERSGLTPEYISRLKHSKRGSNIRTDTAEKLATALDIPVSYLIERRVPKNW